jgi:DNA/RNA-binding protein KIN17
MKCHMKSEGHLRAMRVFSENPNSVIDEFSQEFMRGFVDTLNHRHGTKRVQVNRVYQEYIGDKNHIHMNATCWTSLTGLCKHLGKEGLCVVDETEKGWFIQYIDRDPKLLAKQAAMDQKVTAEVSEEERIQRAIDAQIGANRGGLLDAGEEGGSGATELDKDALKAGTLSMSFSGGASKKRPSVFDSGEGEDDDKPVSKRVAVAAAFGSRADADEADDRPAASSSGSGSSSACSAMESLRAEEERRKSSMLSQEDSKNRKDYWLHPGIVVKIVNKKLSDGKFYKQKGTVLRVLDDYVGEVMVNDSEAVIRLDQADLETVIPKVGGTVVIVNGRGRGCTGTILRINETDYNCDVRVTDGTLGGRELRNVEYEDISKLSSDL